MRIKNYFDMKKCTLTLLRKRGVRQLRNGLLNLKIFIYFGIKVWTLLKIIYGLLECFVFGIFFRGEFIPKLSEDKQFPGELCGAWTTMFGRLDQASECTKLFAAQLLNPFTPGDFAEKRVFKLVELFSGHCRATES